MSAQSAQSNVPQLNLFGSTSTTTAAPRSSLFGNGNTPTTFVPNITGVVKPPATATASKAAVPVKSVPCQDYSLDPLEQQPRTQLMIKPGGRYSDLTLSCEDQKFAVHRLMICNASNVIERALTGSFKEAESGIYTITIFSARAVLFMIHWIYYGDYRAKLEQSIAGVQTLSVSGNGQNDGQRLRAHLELNRLADYYDIPGLKKETRNNIKVLLEVSLVDSSLLSILLDIDQLVTDAELRPAFVTKAATFLHSIVRMLASQPGSYLPPQLMKEVLNVYFKVSQPAMGLFGPLK